MGEPSSDYIPANVWRHGMDGPEPGIRAMPSYDRPGEVILQIRHEGQVLSARLTQKELAELHRQAAIHTMSPSVRRG